MYSVKNTKFSAGDECHSSINGDSYSCTIVYATDCKVVTNKEDVFTKRQDGSWKLKGMNFCRLRHGFLDVLSPEF
jgi:hypothetical protein